MVFSLPGVDVGTRKRGVRDFGCIHHRAPVDRQERPNVPGTFGCPTAPGYSPAGTSAPNAPRPSYPGASIGPDRGSRTPTTRWVEGPGGRAELADQWFQALDSPSKQLIVFDTAGHRPLFERPDLFHTVMTDTVLAETRPGR